MITLDGSMNNEFWYEEHVSLFHVCLAFATYLEKVLGHPFIPIVKIYAGPLTFVSSASFCICSFYRCSSASLIIFHTRIHHTIKNMTHIVNQSTHDPERYAKNASFVYSDAYTAPVLSLLNAQKGERILDIGCGNGNLTIKLHEMVGEEGVVYGTDSNQKMVGHSKFYV